ncbi:hypothetical protein [Streptomyces sp. 2224.1]|uniref:hypothetical protein n=1 Tax=Streptomyces sp. 2224.1 TaxID=1881020 RepID=UPI0015A07942|nr:hypothetical protein [Streptomyces sp. 2224.1]
MTAGSVSRAARAAIFAVVCVTTAALGHALMSAQPVPAGALAAALGATGAAAWWSAGRERGGFAVTGSAVVAQLVLHSLFGLAQSCRSVLGQETAHSASMAPRGEMAGMSQLAGMAGRLAASTAHLGDIGAVRGEMSELQRVHSGHGTFGMFLAHVLAALVCGLWLWRGEAAAFRLARSVAAVWFAPLMLVLATLDPPALKPTARPVAGGGHVLRLRGVFLHHVLSRRGPPKPSFCC